MCSDAQKLKMALIFQGGATTVTIVKLFSCSSLIWLVSFHPEIDWIFTALNDKFHEFRI